MKTLRVLPPPRALGLPLKFSAWTGTQDQIVSDILDGFRQYDDVVLEAPTGVGKSLIYMAVAQLMEVRTVVITATRGLQDQLVADFNSLNLHPMKGMSNYPCAGLQRADLFPDAASYWRAVNSPHEVPTAEEGPCQDGLRCPLRTLPGCDFYDALRSAGHLPLVVTNYAFWLLRQNMPAGVMGLRDGTPVNLGYRGLVVMDEAHDAPGQLLSYLTVELGDWAVNNLIGIHWPGLRSANPEDMAGWVAWAREARKRAEEKLKRRSAGRYSVRLRRLALALGRLSNADTAWVGQRDYDGWRFEPLYPGPFAGLLLSHQREGVEPRGKTLWSSATVRPETLRLLGKDPDSYLWIRAKSPFPISRRPIMHVDGARMDSRTSDEGLWSWVQVIDRIISKRLDRKGIIHTVSYSRAQFLLRHSRHAHLMLVHDSKSTKDVVAQFKGAKAPAILLSPAVSTGYDFPYEECEYVIIGKLAFPDTREPIAKARQKGDKTWGTFVAATRLVQASGRGMRSADDASEVFIVDDHITWFVRKARRYLPMWWREAYYSTEAPPDPPRSLREEKRDGHEA